MSRKDALLRIHKSLVEKRDELRRQLDSEIDQVHAGDLATGDVVDAASDGSQNEMHSQLAAFESRELEQIERAIKLIRTGKYGYCEVCDTPIPVARLKALPYTTVCIACRQKQEITGSRFGADTENWETVFEYEGANNDRELTIRDLDIPAD